MLPRPTSLRSPAWRLDSVLKNISDGTVESSDCPYMDNLYLFLKADEEYVPNEALEEAYLMYYLPQSRAILSSLLISGADSMQISSYIDSSEESVLHFSKLFFDVSVFPNRLVMKDYVDSLPESTYLEKNYKSLLRGGFSLGDRYIAWKMSLNIADSLLPQDVNTDILEDAYWRAREHKPFNIDDTKARESKSWIPQVLRTLDSITNSANSGGEISIEALRLKLVKTDTTTNIHSITEEIKG